MNGNPCLDSEVLDRYRSGRMQSPLEMQRAERHLTNCDSCKARLQAELVGAGSRLAQALLPEREGSDCLDDADMIRYVDGAADAIEKEAIAAHLADCRLCREDVAALQQFKDEMDGYDWSKTQSASPRERFLDKTSAIVERWRERARKIKTGWSRSPLWPRLLVALLLGLLVGLLAGHKAGIFMPVGASLLHLLSVVATPLIFFAVLNALLRTEVQIQAFRKLFFLILTNTLVAVLLGLLIANVLHPGAGALLSAAAPAAGTETLPKPPASLLSPLTENNLLYAILLALVLGIALRETRQEERRAGTSAYRAAEDLIETGYRCMMRLLQWVIALLPLAVFASTSVIVGEYGRRPFQSLGYFALTYLFSCLLQFAYYALRLRIGSCFTLFQILSETRSALLAAFSTNSSAATMPFTYTRVRERLGVRVEAASLGILVGGNVNRDGTAIFEAMGALFLIQAAGITLGAPQQGLLVALAALASVCAPGIPNAALVTLALVFGALHLPQVEPYIILLLPIHWLLGRCCAIVNVIGHITVACLLDGKGPDPAPLTVENEGREESPG